VHSALNAIARPSVGLSLTLKKHVKYVFVNSVCIFFTDSRT